MNPKELKKLADACRKAGIKHYKQGDFEFTLTEEAPTSNYKKRQANSKQSSSAPQSEVLTDTLSQEDLLFWSTGITHSLDETESQS